MSGCKGSRAFRVSKEGEVPRIPTELRGAPKRIGSRFSQLASGHAMTAPFIKEKFGWINSDLCWRCGAARQTREHLFKECIAWKEEIRELWKKVGEASGSSRTVENGLIRMYKGRKGFVLDTQEGSGATRRPGNTSDRDLLADRRFIGFVIDSLAVRGLVELRTGCRLFLMLLRGGSILSTALCSFLSFVSGVFFPLSSPSPSSLVLS